MIYSAYLILNKMQTVYIQYILGIKIRPVHPSHKHVISLEYDKCVKDANGNGFPDVWPLTPWLI